MFKKKGNGTVAAKEESNRHDIGAMVDEIVAKPASQKLTITAPKFETRKFRIRGTTPYVQNKFSHKAQQMIRDKQEAGGTAKKDSKREAKDFQECYEQCQHIAADGWHGIPAPAFRAAMISACRVVGFQMTRAKLSVFVEADGFDKKDGTPLVRIIKGKPHRHEAMVRNETGVVDIRARAMFDEGWEADVRIRYDSEQFTLQDVANLMMRAGMQVGVGEGRPDSKKSTGMGWGMFALSQDAE